MISDFLFVIYCLHVSKMTMCRIYKCFTYVVLPCIALIFNIYNKEATVFHVQKWLEKFRFKFLLHEIITKLNIVQLKLK